MKRFRLPDFDPALRPGAAKKSAGTSRREFLKAGFGTAALAAIGAAGVAQAARTSNGHAHGSDKYSGAGDTTMVPMPMLNGEVDHTANGFNPTEVLTDFDWGRESRLPSGQTVRDYDISAADKTIEVATGIGYPAFLFNGRLPGPTLRAREGDHIRITFTNGSAHPHTMHFHGIHPGSMDGVYEQVKPGKNFVYEFEAEPFGVHLYHCHTSPLAKHIAKGLYGAFIIDPAQGRPPVDKEFVMVLSGIDVDFDDENDFYVVNGIPFHYDRNPIALKVGELVRIFVINILEYDPINSFHIHANFFHYYPTGTSLTPSEFTDTIPLVQGQRGIMEFSYKFPGRYMFHAHKTEFAELGWTGLFDVTA
jgi:FtsP/CotA-like multicopper oxidase with cupredoxin domain